MSTNWIGHKECGLLTFHFLIFRLVFSFIVKLQMNYKISIRWNEQNNKIVKIQRIVCAFKSTTWTILCIPNKTNKWVNKKTAIQSRAFICCQTNDIKKNHCICNKLNNLLRKIHEFLYVRIKQVNRFHLIRKLFRDKTIWLNFHWN